MKEIEHPALITEWTRNIEKSVHKENLEKRDTHKPSQKRNQLLP